MNAKVVTFLLVLAVGLLATSAASAQCPSLVPAQGAALPGPLPLFPPNHWWNLDVAAAPVDPASASYIAFINNGGTRRLHPDFGGEASPGSEDIYGMPYAIVDGAPFAGNRRHQVGTWQALETVQLLHDQGSRNVVVA